MSRLIRCDAETKKLLAIKSEMTGQSIPKLIRIAVVNMPFIPPKNVVKKRK